MLKLLLSGVIGADATITETSKGKAINFDVAVSKDYKNSKGEKVEKTEWVRAVIWRFKDSDTKVAEYLKKGRKVLIEGDPYSNGYQSKDGEVKSSLNVKVEDIEFLN